MKWFAARQRKDERGAALLVAMTLVMTAGLSLAMDALLIYGKRTREDKRATTVLATAKRSLLAYTATHPSGGSAKLPCAFHESLSMYETLTAYTVATGCGTNAAADVGFLPWQAMQLPPLRDGDNAPIWYAVSANCGLQINSTGDYAAILLAPGKLLSGQTRDWSVDPAPQNAYLDGANATASVNFVSSGVINSTFNDRLLGIRCDEVP